MKREIQVMDLALRDDRLAVLAQQGRCFPGCWIDAWVHCPRANCGIVTGGPKRGRPDPSGAFSLDKVWNKEALWEMCMPGSSSWQGRYCWWAEQPSCIPFTPQLVGEQELQRMAVPVPTAVTQLVQPAVRGTGSNVCW